LYWRAKEALRRSEPPQSVFYFLSIQGGGGVGEQIFSRRKGAIFIFIYITKYKKYITVRRVVHILISELKESGIKNRTEVSVVAGWQAPEACMHRFLTYSGNPLALPPVRSWRAEKHPHDLTPDLTSSPLFTPEQ
jgi:hypothetical protein